MPKIVYEKITRVTSTAYTVLSSDDVILVDASSAAVTITLPAVDDLAGKRIRIVKIDSSANIVTIEPDGSETLASASNDTIIYENGALELMSDGISNWEVVGANGLSVGTLDVNGLVKQTGSVGTNTFAADVIINNDLTVDLTSTLTGNVACGANLTVAGTFAVALTSIFSGNVTIDSTNTLVLTGGALSVGGISTLTGDVTCSADLTVDVDLLVSGNAVVTGTLGVTGLASLTTLAVSGLSTFSGNVAIDGSNTFTVAGVSTFSGNVIIDGSNTFTIGTGLANLAGALTVAGTTTLNGSLVLGGSNTLTVGTGTTILGGLVQITGDTELSDDLELSNSSALRILPFSQTIGLAGDIIVPDKSGTILTNTTGSDITLSRNPAVDAPSGEDGNFFILVGKADTNKAVIFTSTTAFKLGAATRSLNKRALLAIYYCDGIWHEVGFTAGDA